MDEVALVDEGIGLSWLGVVNFLGTQRPMIVHPPKNREGILVVVRGPIVIVDIACSHAKAQTSDRHEIEVGIHLSEALGNQGNLGADL